MSAKRGQSQSRKSFSWLNIGAFLRWWGRGLLLCLPAPLRRVLTAPPRRLVFALGGDELAVLEELTGKLHVLARKPLQALADGSIRNDLPSLKEKQIVLRLPAEQVLHKEITLPQAAQANLRQVVGFDIDRLTPFPADKIYYDAQLIGEHADNRTLRVQFAAVLRSVLDPLTGQLRTLGLMPEVVTVAGGPSSLNLLPPEQRPQRRGTGRGLRRVLLLLIVLTLAALAILPLWQQRSVVVALLPEVETSQREAEVALRLREELDVAIETSQFLLAKRHENVLFLDMLNELTALLPDTTWIEQLNIKGCELQMRGQSLEASSLLGVIEESTLFQAANFKSPVTKDRRTNKDRFFLAATIRNCAV